jgi:hypothetical protein
LHRFVQAASEVNQLHISPKMIIVIDVKSIVQSASWGRMCTRAAGCAMHVRHKVMDLWQIVI